MKIFLIILALLAVVVGIITITGYQVLRIIHKEIEPEDERMLVYDLTDFYETDYSGRFLFI